MYKKLPSELKENAVFCLWRYEERGGKLEKAQYQINGRRMRVFNKHTFSDFQLAVKSLSGYDGLGKGTLIETSRVSWAITGEPSGRRPSRGSKPSTARIPARTSRVLPKSASPISRSRAVDLCSTRHSTCQKYDWQRHHQHYSARQAFHLYADKIYVYKAERAGDRRVQRIKIV